VIFFFVFDGTYSKFSFASAYIFTCAYIQVPAGLRETFIITAAVDNDPRAPKLATAQRDRSAVVRVRELRPGLCLWVGATTPHRSCLKNATRKSRPNARFVVRSVVIRRSTPRPQPGICNVQLPPRRPTRAHCVDIGGQKNLH
jgi:hypothetical protein